jgi:hypothetical protein
VEFDELFLRRGMFKLAKEFVEREPTLVMTIMSKMIIVRAESMYFGDLEYMAMSPMFDKLKMGDVIPEYIVAIRYEGNSIVGLQAERLDKKNNGTRQQNT